MSPSLDVLQAVYAATLRKLTATTIAAVVDAEHEIKVLVLGDSQALREMRQWVLDSRRAGAAVPVSAVAPPPPAAPLSVPPMPSRPQGSLFL